MHVWEDPDGQADLIDVRALPDSAWRAVARRDASFGYSGSTYWLRLDVHNPHNRSLGWVLLISNPLLVQLDAYGLDGKRIYRAGDQRPFDWRWVEHRQLVLPLDLESGEQQRIWLRMQTDGSANLSASLLEHLRCSHYLVSTSGALFRHPHKRALDLILEHHPGPGHPTLHFNYLTRCTAPWSEQADQKSRGYRALHPKGTSLTF